MPGGRLRVLDERSRVLQLAVWQDGAWRPLAPVPGADWGFCTVPTDSTGAPRADRARVADVDGDGRADVVVAAACASGVGDNGARYDPRGAVYLQRAPGQFVADTARSDALTDTLAVTCADEDGPCVIPR